MTAQQLAAMRAMLALHKPDSAIGRRYGLTRQRVHQILGKRPPAPRRAAPAAPVIPVFGNAKSASMCRWPMV